MAKAIIKDFLLTQSNFVIFRGQLFRYNGKSRIYSKEIILINDFIKNAKLFDKIKKSDFNQFNVLSNYVYSDNSRENLIKYFTERKNRLNDNVIRLYRQLTPKEIDCYYKFDVCLEIKGILIRPGQYIQHGDYPNDVAIVFEERNHWHLGRKQIPAPMEPQISAHLVPKKDIDKIIGIKRFKNIELLGTEKEDSFTGEQEEFVLDLNEFDEKVYQIFLQHEAITIT
jgi:hypothetical protein